jgi:hypothetical protein
VTTISAHTYDALREKCDELRAENARLREALAAAPRWVSVTERLPEPDAMCAVLFGDVYYRCARWLGDVWVVPVIVADPITEGLPVTHWLELPPAPGAEGTR